MTPRAAMGSSIGAVAVLASASCGPTLYFYTSSTRTYEYERAAPIVVRSEPAGATIALGDGRVLGQAPLILEDKQRVRRTRRSRPAGRAVLGCIADFVVGALAFRYWDDHPDSRWARLGGLAGLGAMTSCGGLALTHTIAWALSPFREADQLLAVWSAPDEVEDAHVARSIDVVARWRGFGSARATVEPGITALVTLHLPRSYSFDEAIARWAETAGPSLSPESIYRVGTAYRNLARAGIAGARERARELLDRYLASGAAMRYAGEARRMLGELAAMERGGR